MADKTSIEGSVKLERLDLDSSARVAYDLMRLISNQEQEQNKDRNYYLKLYSDCHKVATGWEYVK